MERQLCTIVWLFRIIPGTARLARNSETPHAPQLSSSDKVSTHVGSLPKPLPGQRSSEKLHSDREAARISWFLLAAVKPKFAGGKIKSWPRQGWVPFTYRAMTQVPPGGLFIETRTEVFDLPLMLISSELAPQY